MRLAALMDLPSISVYTHDSIGLGEDGPTHQPIEQLAPLRATPNLNVVRPADANETALAWRFALPQTDTPVAFALSRQGLPVLDPDAIPATRSSAAPTCSRVARSEPDLILIGTGSEVPLAMEAAELLEGDGIATRVVSMPCMDLFASRTTTTATRCCRRRCARAGRSRRRPRSAGTAGSARRRRCRYDHRFGESGPNKDVYEHFGITPEKIAEAGAWRRRASRPRGAEESVT